MPTLTDLLSPDELQRYHRHLILPTVGEEGQRRLKAAHVLLVGAGGLGSPAALYLTAAGVGHIGIVDADEVELSNLQRQVLHGTRDVGRAKVTSARERLRDLNPHVSVVTHHTRLTSANAMELLRDYDVVLDGSDNFPTRYLISDASILLGIPNVYGSVTRFEGQASVFGVEGGPCYRCLFPEPPPPGLVTDCAEGGVFGVLPGMIGIIQATDVIKLLTRIGEPLVGRLLLVDALRMEFHTIALQKNPDCPACGTRELTSLTDYDAFCGVPTVEMTPTLELEDEWSDEITPLRLAARLQNGSSPAVVDVREPYEWAIGRIPGARLVPLDSLPQAVPSPERDAELVVYCHHGVRSAAAVTWLRDQGFTRVRNLVGGIDRWSIEVDPSLRRY
jgi:sulfur-carrier protein adenylyltransferase/sulfurtransferase